MERFAVLLGCARSLLATSHGQRCREEKRGCSKRSLYPNRLRKQVRCTVLAVDGLIADTMQIQSISHNDLGMKLIQSKVRVVQKRNQGCLCVELLLLALADHVTKPGTLLLRRRARRIWVKHLCRSKSSEALVGFEDL